MHKEKMKVFLISIVIAIWTNGCAVNGLKEPERINQSETLAKPYVILVSIDGYRYDYTSKYSPPVISQFMSAGTSTKELLPVYPSKTFTNHYSIVTGLFAENHGIVANSFYDPLRKEEYNLSNSENVRDGTWYNGTPIWVAAEQQGMLAANYFWPGSEAAIQGVRPSYFIPYDEKKSLVERINQVKKWLDLSPNQRPHFITLYFSEVDSAGHKYGPQSNEVKEAVFKVDRAIGHLVEQMKTVPLPVNIIIVSDHGMQEINPNNVEYLDDYTDIKRVRFLGGGPQASLYLNDSRNMAKVYGDLKAKAKHFQVYKRDEIPERFHYSKSARCGDLIIVAESPYLISLRNKSPEKGLGNHGFDPDTTQSMHGIFYALGPQIKKRTILAPFRNVHIYPLIMRILGLKILTPIDGNSAVLEPVYVNGSNL